LGHIRGEMPTRQGRGGKKNVTDRKGKKGGGAKIVGKKKTWP